MFSTVPEAALTETDTSRLNGLTVASTVHLLEPQWNPAVENQAIGRVLRLDQQNKVTVVRYTVEKTIEKVSTRNVGVERRGMSTN